MFGQEPKVLKLLPDHKKPIELSAEQIEQVVAKMCDINAPGTAYTRVSPGALKRILQEGILSKGKYVRSLKEWAERTRKIREQVIKDKGYDIMAFDDWEKMGVFINIVGRRGREFHDQATVQEGFRERDISILVDLSSYEEVLPFNYYFETEPMPARTYKATNMISYDDWKKAFGDRPKEEYNKVTWDELREKMPRLFDNHGKVRTQGTSHGFYVSYNIPPKLLQGIIVDYRIPLNDVIESMFLAYERGGRKMHSLLPVYKYTGDMLWPKGIGYEEIKQRLAEREQKSVVD